jgi:hypothetical protein
MAMGVPNGVRYTFEVTVYAALEEQAVQVLEQRLAPVKDLGDPTEPGATPFPYILDWKREPRRG